LTPSTAAPAAVEGLRDRKKRRTRQAISDIATRLFFERGFEAVTLADIADAAEVSVKTIFNHFGSKEDLFFDRADEFRASIVETIADRPPGTTVLAAMRKLLVENLVPFVGAGWEGLPEPGEINGFRAYLATQDRSPALRARRLTMMEEVGDLLTGVIAAELGREPDDPALLSLAAMLGSALELRARVLSHAVLTHRPPDEIRRRVIETVEVTFDRLAAAFADVDRPH
jgi:AcrR family transcriptional regulator